jgi:polyhydroxyalkanoate synthesis regulator phasin
MKMSNLRTKLKDLQEGVSADKSQQSDVDACKGEIEVLRKELQSLEDGGHTTFIKAKTMLEPKKNLSSKGKKLEWKTNLLKTRLKSAEKKLFQEEGISSKLKDKQQKIVDDLKEQIQMLGVERTAIDNFNHTRFVQLKNQQSEGDKQTRELQEVENKIKEIEEKISKCKESEECSKEQLMNDLHLAKMEKESIENFTHDDFLENLESMKAKRRSGLK